ncbi:phenylalanine--tRNA ligase subunit beta [Paraperlucidibaca sp.]|jgi:phenylalanyl-tRNA synthetase beta chain|uniref:phenylalanine--tRNA ligase subunit beta n=1 Tax=Paraperlucidibaca sp. TaxID=2708021 RepID=UPI0030F36F9A
MQFSEQRLRRLASPAVNTADLAHQLTMAGLEVDAIESMAPAFIGVVVGRVVSTEPHPDADKLRVAMVDIAQPELLQIVCGAANVRADIRVPVATIGAVLPGDFRIKAAKLRGVASSGMLCAEQELGLAEQSDGLWELPLDAPIGADIREYLALDDQLITLGLTPNRGDCLSLRGLAREAAAVFDLDIQLSLPSAMTATTEHQRDIVVEDTSACPRYVGRVIRGLRQASSPAWLVDGLRRYGVRSVSPLVDITQWVMLELGQPMHAFDEQKLNGSVRVRRANAAEALTLLDGQVLSLRESSLVIADDHGAIALAGVMGGQGSAVSDTTVDVFLEAAHFDPLTLAGEARRYGLHTDASHRFERGVDAELPRHAIELATALIIEVLGGEAGPVLEMTNAKHLPQRLAINLRRQRITRVLGFSIDDARVIALLKRLGMQIEASNDGWLVTPPSHRFDISIEVDLIEELARLTGYNNIPVTPALAAIKLAPRTESAQSLRRLKRALVDMGYQEAITFSFTEASVQQAFTPNLTPLTLANPLSQELASMRTSLLPGLLMAVRHNQSRQQSRIRLFEAGMRFLPKADGLVQEPMLAGVLVGSALPMLWSNTKTNVDFYDLKGNIEHLLSVARVATLRFVSAQRDGFHPGQCAEIYEGDTCLGVLGAIHPSTLAAFDVDGPVFAFELSQQLLALGSLPGFTPLSRFPQMQRDLALLVPLAVNADAVISSIRQHAGADLQRVDLFDVYRGAGLPEGYYSLAITVIWQHAERTLLDAEVQSSVDNVLTALADLAVRLR